MMQCFHHQKYRGSITICHNAIHLPKGSVHHHGSYRGNTGSKTGAASGNNVFKGHLMTQYIATYLEMKIKRDPFEKM